MRTTKALCREPERVFLLLSNTDEIDEVEFFFLLLKKNLIYIIVVDYIIVAESSDLVTA